MIKQAIEYIVNLGKTEIKEIRGQQYSTTNLQHIDDPAPEALVLSTLTGLIDYIKHGIDKHTDTLLLQVKSYKDVQLLSQLKCDSNRDCYINAMAPIPVIRFGDFLDTEKFNIMLQSSFIESSDREALLSIIGNIREEAVKTVGDDGISQTVTAKQGIARVGNVKVPNPVVLAPFRTFTEVEQPFSKFIFRMQDGPRAALFEADGGAWRLEAMQNIKKYLEEELAGCNVRVIA